MTNRPSPPKVTLDRVRPTVVRRRVFETSQTSPPPPGTTPGFVDDDDDENGPPSSVNVARALASLRGHELRRLDEILTRDDERAPRAPPEPPAPPPAPSVPTVGVGSSIALVELARRMSISQEELVTALVTRGFFDVTVKATLPRETARAVGAIFGWQIEDTDEVPPPAKPKALKTKAARSAPAKPKPKPKPAKSAKPKTAKPRTKPKPKKRAR